MPSEHSKNKKLAKKNANKAKKSTPETDAVETTKSAPSKKPEKQEVPPQNARNDAEFEGSDDENAAKYAKLCDEIESMNLCSERVAEFRSVTGVLASHKDSRDLHIRNLTCTFHGKVLMQETFLELNNGNRYGLLGANGCGKSTLFAILNCREVPIPPHLDIFLLQREMPPSNKTAIECVMEVDEETTRLEDEIADLCLIENPNAEIQDRMNEIYSRLEELDASVAEKNAGEILHGLGFTKAMQQKQVKHFSGGWRMRIALARALFVKPAILLLDEPTNHLDLGACVWLEERLANYPRCLVVISHSQDFLNGVCTNIINMRQQKLFYYKGDYDTYVRTRAEQEGNQMKLYKKQEADKAAIKEFVAKYGHGTRKMARQAQSREKLLAKLEAENSVEKVVGDKNLAFYFPDPDPLAPPVVQIQSISFRYGDDKPLIYKDVDLGVDLDTRAALVGPNGAGKSTLLKLIAAELEPTDGMIKRHSHVRFGRFHQHLHEKLDMSMTPLDWMMREFPNIKERDDMRKRLGRYGITGEMQTSQIMSLSDGQRCRIIFSWLALQTPSILLLDEPTNHLDIETIDSLAAAINCYSGGMLLVSHDFRLIDQVADELWVCENQTVTVWKGDIYSYKERLIKEMKEDQKKHRLTER